MTPRGRKILFGCLFGCAGLAVAVTVAVVAFFIWLNRPGTLLEGERLVDGSTVGYASCRLSLDDPATDAVLMRAFELLQGARDRPGMPGGDFRQMLEAFSGSRDRKKFRALFPVQVTWSEQPGDRHLFVAGITGNANQVRVFDLVFRGILGDDPDSRIVQDDYRDEQLFVSDDFTAFLRSGNVVVGSDETAARSAVDRFVDGPAPPDASSPFADVWARVPRDRTLHGALLNRDGRFGELVDESAVSALDGAGIGEQDLETVLASLRADLDGMESLVFGGDFSGDDALRLELTLRCREAGCAGIDRDRLGSFLARGFAEELDAEATPRTTADGLRLEVVVDGLVGRVEGWWAESLRGQQPNSGLSGSETPAR